MLHWSPQVHRMCLPVHSNLRSTLNSTIHQPRLNVLTPTIIFPYASETVNSLVTRAGFMSINLPPVNFEMLYAQRMQAQAQQNQQQEENK